MKQVGWYRLYDQGEYGVQIMHYSMNGTPGQCSTCDHYRLNATIEALETPWPQNRADVEPMFWLRHEEPFSWEGSK